MVQITSQCARNILTNLNCSKPILLRGGESILQGKRQNDIDLYIDPENQDLKTLFFPNILIDYSITGPNQKKIFLHCSLTNETVEIDLFSRINWLGLSIIEMKKIPLQFDESLKVFKLPEKVELWLTVTKNVLHNSITPNEKLSNDANNPTFPVYSSKRSIFESFFKKFVWYSVNCNKKYFGFFVFFTRIFFILIHFSNNFSKSIESIFFWLKIKLKLGGKK